MVQGRACHQVRLRAAAGEVEVPQQRQRAVCRILQVAVVSEAVLTAVGWQAVKKKEEVNDPGREGVRGRCAVN